MVHISQKVKMQILFEVLQKNAIKCCSLVQKTNILFSLLQGLYLSQEWGQYNRRNQI